VHANVLRISHDHIFQNWNCSFTLHCGNKMLTRVAFGILLLYYVITEMLSLYSVHILCIKKTSRCFILPIPFTFFQHVEYLGG
jgi:hypothetical protein